MSFASKRLSSYLSYSYSIVCKDVHGLVWPYLCGTTIEKSQCCEDIFGDPHQRSWLIGLSWVYGHISVGVGLNLDKNWVMFRERLYRVNASQYMILTSIAIQMCVYESERARLSTAVGTSVNGRWIH